MILYINSCVREDSRTDKIARALLKKLGDYEEINLNDEMITPLNNDALAFRDEKIQTEDFSSDLFKFASKFSQAEKIVISAPYWDLSFPSKLKIFIENICVNKLTFKYSENGMPVGLCKADKLYYVATAGGKFMPEYGYNYIRDLSKMLFGIKDTELIFAEFLDIQGNDPQKIIEETIQNI